MNVLFVRVHLALIALLLSQQSFCMQQPQILGITFPGFSYLEPDIQIIIIRHSDNQAHIQSTSKYWSQQMSIKTPGAVTDAFCVAHPERVTQILLNAVYVQNYKGVENILKNSCILDITNARLPHFYIDSYDRELFVLDLHGIACYKQDKKMCDVLDTYKVNVFQPGTTVCRPTELMMDCLAGNSDSIFDSASESNDNREKALKIAIDFDHGKCITALLENVMVDSNWIDIVENGTSLKMLLIDDVLERAIKKPKLKALEALLATYYFDVNRMYSFSAPLTLLGKYLLKARTKPQCEAVVLLLRRYGAKTVEELEKDEEAEKDVITRSMCIIS